MKKTRKRVKLCGVDRLMIMVIALLIVFTPVLVVYSKSTLSESNIELERIKRKVEKQNKMVEEIVNGYEEGKMENIKMEEITFICDKYYLVDTGFYDMMCNYLEGKHLNQSRVG